MFRAQQNSFDDAIAKATDEQLTSENWELILDVCDRVTAEDTGAKDAVASMIRRLAHRNANVQLYTLELANSLSQNCGVKMHRELASRSFTDAVLRLANDRNTHQQVKAKIVELLGEWTEMFAKDPDLGVMEQAFIKLRSQSRASSIANIPIGVALTCSQDPTLLQPSKPTKQQITDTDRRKEEEELQLVLELSIKEKAAAAQAEAEAKSEAKSQAQPQPTNKNAGQAAKSGAVAPTQQTSKAISSGATAASVSRVRALYDFQPTEAGELQFQKGDIIAVLESVYKDWWKGSLRGQTGIFPLNYVEKILDPTQEDLQLEAQAEAEVFGEIKNVEKLLTLLSTSSPESTVKDDEEISELYQSMLAIRPKLVELIKKYTQRKDDFSHLNEKFIKASRDYELLIDASSQPARQQYGRKPQPYAYGQVGYPGQDPSGQNTYPVQGAAAQQPTGRVYPSDPRAQAHNPPSQPFFVAGQAAQPPSQGPLHFLPTDPRSRIPSGSSKTPPQPSDPYHPRPESTYNNPQELGPSATPTTETRPQTFPNPKPAHAHNPSVDDDLYSADDEPIHTHPPPHQQQAQPPYPSTPYTEILPLGSQKPGALSPGYPPGTYQAYRAPGTQQQHPPPGPKPSYPPGGGNPNDFYQ